MNNQTNEDTLQNVLTEKELLELLGLKKAALSRLRNENRLPFLRVSRTSRLYLESDVVKWLKSRKIVLNRALTNVE